MEERGERGKGGKCRTQEDREHYIPKKEKLNMKLIEAAKRSDCRKKERKK